MRIKQRLVLFLPFDNDPRQDILPVLPSVLSHLFKGHALRDTFPFSPGRTGTDRRGRYIKQDFLSGFGFEAEVKPVILFVV